MNNVLNNFIMVPTATYEPKTNA